MGSAFLVFEQHSHKVHQLRAGEGERYMAVPADLSGGRVPYRSGFAGLAHPSPQAGWTEGHITMPALLLCRLHSAGHEIAGIAPQAVVLPPPYPAQKYVASSQGLEAPEEILAGVCQGQVLIHPVDQILRALVQIIGRFQGLLGVIALVDHLQHPEDGGFDIPLGSGQILFPERLLAFGGCLQIVDPGAHVSPCPLGDRNQQIGIAVYALSLADRPQCLGDGGGAHRPELNSPGRISE